MVLKKNHGLKKEERKMGGKGEDIVCLRSSDPFYVVTYYIKLATTSWTHCSKERNASNQPPNKWAENNSGRTYTPGLSLKIYTPALSEVEDLNADPLSTDISPYTRERRGIPARNARRNSHTPTTSTGTI